MPFAARGRPRALAAAVSVLPVLLAPAMLLAGLFAALPVTAAAKAPPKGFTPPPPVIAAPRPADGSIFNVSAGYAPLIEGTRARAVGDIVTIVLTEATTANKTAITKTQRAGNNSVTPPTAGPFALNPSALNSAAQATFNGQGNTSQTNALNATITVTIVSVRPNGTAEVRGEKEMLLTQGTEWIQFSGIVRLVDINPDTDSVLSTQVANAHIEYAGNGTVARAAREGWLSRFFAVISPF